RFS
ncbi:hypothetical protein CP8484711_1451B, partial [Chlamydia psittaci 84-8471/1]